MKKVNLIKGLSLGVVLLAALFLGEVVTMTSCTSQIGDDKTKKEGDANEMVLPPPQVGKLPFLSVLKRRQSSRDFSSKKLSQQVLSNILYAAFGINRPDSGRRTAPTTHNWQYIDVYGADDEGVFLYNALNRSVKRVLKEDVRAKTGEQSFVATAPLNLLFVYDDKKWGDIDDEEEKKLSVTISVGAIVQNVYLICASHKLNTIVRSSFDHNQLHKLMKLRPEQKIIITQTIGYPKTSTRLKNWVKKVL